jgi:protein-tyrosine phosphatase
MSVENSGRFDVHSHLLPGVDDGCASEEESLRCAREMVAAGYTHSFCTPHFWTSYPKTTVPAVQKWVVDFQKRLDEENVPLKLLPGGEINLRANLGEIPIRDLPTFGMEGKFVLIDLWADKLPKFFEPTIRWMQSGGLTVILAHPERMRAVQDDPKLGDYFSEIGLLLQGNLQCFSDRENAPTRVTVERFLMEDRYFMLGSDLHNFETLPNRLNGLQRAIEMVGEGKIGELTVGNPRKLAAF